MNINELKSKIETENDFVLDKKYYKFFITNLHELQVQIKKTLP